MRTPVIPNPDFNPKKDISPDNPPAFNRAYEDGGMEVFVLNEMVVNPNGPGYVRVNARTDLASYFTTFAAMKKERAFPYTGIVMDEYSELLRRIEVNIDQDPSFGKDHFGRMDVVKEEHDFYCSMKRALDVPIIGLAHDREPTYESSETAFNRGLPTYGKLKYKGGPALPFGKMIDAMVQKTDVCVRMVMKSGLGKRVFLTKPQPDYFAKCRGEVDDEEPADLPALLRKALYRAGV